VAWAIGGGGAVMLLYATWAYRSSHPSPAFSMHGLSALDSEALGE
jgi:hypothetical protein